MTLKEAQNYATLCLQLRPLGDEMEELWGALRAAEDSILASLLMHIRSSKEMMLRAVRGATRLDVAFARLKFGQEVKGVVPIVKDRGVIDVKSARHPVLELRRVRPVANDACVGRKGVRGLVITGPNAGGKTVVMKTLGLFGLMVSMGIPIPCSPGARFDFFTPVIADIGDLQSVTGDLSTFSGHILVAKEVLRRTGAIISEDGSPREKTEEGKDERERKEGAAGEGAEVVEASDLGRDAGCPLVLMDEMGTGTEPHQGAALAQAMLEALVTAEARVVVTTHFVQVKEMALRDERFAVAGMEWVKGRPTYRLKMNEVGESLALDLAGRLGVPSEILDRAHDLLADDIKRATALQARLEKQVDEYNDLIQDAKRDREAAERLRNKLQEHRLRAELRADELVKELAKRQIEEFREKGREMDELLEKLKKQEREMAERTESFQGGGKVEGSAARTRGSSSRNPFGFAPSARGGLTANKAGLEIAEKSASQNREERLKAQASARQLLSKLPKEVEKFQSEMEKVKKTKLPPGWQLLKSGSMFMLRETVFVMVGEHKGAMGKVHGRGLGGRWKVELTSGKEAGKHVEVPPEFMARKVKIGDENKDPVDLDIERKRAIMAGKRKF
uniref:DNA mismatch repair proteins mutS family domain-containing protein n=1 Tax=Chromera velia CCMP2878 TaxID=1169474 RepID=A0A0G4HI44_9ALVE|eukprot:Cvel_1063.t1-p1 / transcript=Cvel_1063.t1 / gene=Cvel_1063 / organism=Chromera_velia_CCMP2878 / gene_product=MutS2 protein, putative / transcript_product=MutS2 protein, putative / location=Cvel_scaffold34:136675-142616(-) / protein_length=618 / sequence_SO=supercontig / SO=protein_coding / is_pseudo=false